MQVTIILDNLRSVHNVGSIFRTANALSVDEIILCGTTPTPLDRYGNKRGDFAKVALGAEETIAWKYEEHTKSVVHDLQSKGYYVIALEQDVSSIDYKKITVENKEHIAFVFGAEVDGVSKEVCDMCDVIAEIPMRGSKESLNVSISGAVLLFRVLDK